MSELKELQRRMASAVMTPLTRSDGMQKRLSDGSSMAAHAGAFILPNDRLTSFERLEIYNRQYWFRLLDALIADFSGLRAVVGERRFERLSVAYLTDCPSTSFTLRNLGSRVLPWLRSHPEWIEPRRKLALDMVRLEWAHVEAYDAGDDPILGPEDLLEVTPESRFGIQPHIRLLQLAYPVDDLLFAIREDANQPNDAAVNAVSRQRKAHPAVAKIGRLDPRRIYLAVYRKDFSVYHRRLTRESFRVLRSLKQGSPLGTALQDAVRGSRLRDTEIMGNLREWFSDWAQMGWFTKSEPHRMGISVEDHGEQ